MNRLEMKRRRLELMDEQTKLDKERCDQCSGELQRTPGGRIMPTAIHCTCSAATRIREIGEELNRLSTNRRKPPEHLNVEAYRLLKDWEWEEERIRKHYGITQQDWTFWKHSNGLMIRKPKTEEEPKMVAEQKGLTVAMIDDLRAKGESWELIGKRMGVTGVTAKNRYDRMKAEQPKPEKVVDLSPLHKRIEQLENENDKLRLELLNERKTKSKPGLEDRINELAKQLNRSKESYEELEEDLRHQRKINGQHVSHIESLGKTIDDLRGELEAAKPLTVEEDTSTLNQQLAYAQQEVRRLQDARDYDRERYEQDLRDVKEDHAASEDYYQQEIAKLTRILNTVQNYVDVLEGGTR